VEWANGRDLAPDRVKEVATMTELSGIERPGSSSPEYEAARKRVERKRKFRADVAAYLVINAFLIGAWSVTGFGYFWPGWVLAGWGVALILDVWNVYFQRPITDDDIARELHSKNSDRASV
jgi:hypothetical protein